MKPFLVIVGSMIGLGALTWGVTYHDLIFTSFFAPKFEDVRRNTFEQSKSFRTGVERRITSSQAHTINYYGKI